MEDNYAFNQKIHMHLVSFDNNGNKDEEGEFITHLNEESKSMAYEVVSGNMANSEYGLFIIDATNGAMILLSQENGEKTGLIYGMGAFFQSIGESYEEEMDLSETPDSYLANPNVKKTGKTKDIAGYKCEQYLYEDETTESEIWITKSLKMKSRDFFGTLFKISAYSSGMAWGYMMETTSLDKRRGTKTIATVTDINTNSKVLFSLSDYKISNIGNLTIPSGVEEK